jgi:hypothetical protein
MSIDPLTHQDVHVFAQQTRDATLDAIVASLIVLLNALPLLVFAAL